jgi:hypothetical protein
MADRRSIKKQQSGQLMGVRIEGRVMVHRTDIAGGSAGPISPGNGCACRRKRNGALLADSFPLKRKAMLSSADDGNPVGSCHPFRIRAPRRL